ncbi:hypothetical protein [Streptomyces sp. NPDC055632]
MRGIAVAAALVMSLTACDGGDGDVDATDAVLGKGQSQGQPQAQVVSLDPTGLMHALPVESAVGDVFVGSDPVMVQGAEAAQFCGEQFDGACTGVTAAGLKEMVVRGSSSREQRIDFMLLTFGTEKEAAALVKGAAERQKARKDSFGSYQPVTVEAGADETRALGRSDFTSVYMRVGTVVSYMRVSRIETEDVQYAAKVQVDRIRTVAAGGNPGH